MCAETSEMRGYMAALEAAAYILVSGVKLASHADSSSGMLTDVIMCTYELIDKRNRKRRQTNAGSGTCINYKRGKKECV